MKKKLYSLLIAACFYAPIFAETDEPKPCLTVFVHGIMSVKYHVSFPNIILFIKDKIFDSAYQKTVEIIRNDPYFHQSHPIQKAGLHKVDISLEEPGAATSLFARLWEQMDAYNNPELYDNIYYTYGWTGLLSPTVRRFEARVLFNSLKEELKKYHEQNIYPKIRIVGYSHGGNVALDMAHANKKNKIVIDELILIGVPVVKSNDFVLSHKMFKRIYHFYSKGDRVQNLDLLSWQRWFAIPKNRNKFRDKLPENLTQIQLGVKRLTNYQLQHAPRTADGTLLSYHKRAMRVSDPGHTELWSFGWGTSSYSKYNPLYPLPSGVFAPFIVNAIKHEAKFQEHIIADIYTHENKVLLQNKHKTAINKKINFVPKHQLDKMFSLAQIYEPANYSIKEYDQRVEQAKKQGRLLAQQEKQKIKSQKKA